MSIPASAYVNILPSIISGGGAALALNAVMLTQNAAVPIGAVQPFATADDVGKFFGPSSAEKTMADVYFAGYDNSTAKPGNLFFAQYPAAPVAAYVRGGSMAAVTLDQLKTFTGVMTVGIDGVTKTSSVITLTAATSFSNAATIIQAAFTSLGGTVTYDSVRQAFVITSATTGVASTVGYPSGTIVDSLNMGQADGAVLSQGAIASTPAAAMDAIKVATLNWATFMTLWEPLIADKLAFAAWTNAQNKRFMYSEWDTDITATQSGNQTTLGPQLKASNSSGTSPFYGTAVHAAFVCGFAASIDFTATNGRPTAAYKSQNGLATTVSDATIAANLKANGFNYYGSVATAADQFQFMMDGVVSGDFAYIDSYLCQIRLNSQFQLALLNLLTASPSIPYNDAGYSLVEAACLDPITEALNFGSIRANVPLSAQQKALVNAAAGTQIDTVLSSRGWYLQIREAAAQTRSIRETPPIKFWYMDGGSIQHIEMASIAIQ